MMGYRGTTNALLHFGDERPCIGYLLGEANSGLSHMFQMMNEARIAVSLGATALGAAGYSASLAYARERAQGRHPDGKDARSQQVPIIEHADVKRLLLAQKAAVEGALALLLYTATLVDRIRIDTAEDERHEHELLLGLLTPIAKSWPSEFCLEANRYAIQILGGSSYARDYPVVRLHRDNRLNAIHEGTHGIQALDLLGRKIPQSSGAALKIPASRIQTDVDTATKIEALRCRADVLGEHLAETLATTESLVGMLASQPRLALANATLYLDMMATS